jgi:O-antigen ligase
LLERQEPGWRGRQPLLANKAEESLNSAFFWLCAFWFVYCARPEDFIPGLKYIPLAKITGLFTLIALVSSAGKTKRSLRDLPREGRYLIGLTCFLVCTSVISPVWRGGALAHSLDFAKGTVAWVLTFLLVTTFQRLRRIIFIQAASVAMVATVSVLKGHNTPRLEGVLNGMYFNANDLAFALVLSLPFCLAFFLQARGFVRKAFWMFSMMFMGIALVLTASRAGFICLLISGSVTLWHFGVKGKRPQLILGTLVVGAVLLIVAGGRLKDRFVALSGKAAASEDQSAYGSYLQRKELMIEAVKAIGRYPLYGLGVNNFVSYAGYWREVHNSYLEMGAEGGVPALVLYLLFFSRGFANLRKLRKRRDLDPHVALFVGALHSSLVGFVVGALFEPEAYQLFSYIAVAQTSVIWAIIQERDAGTPTPPVLSKLSLSDRRRNTDRTSSESSPNPVVG